MLEVICDFETVNPYCDLTVVGSTVYSEHWATEILCLRWRVGDNRMQKWTPGYDAESGPLHHIAAVAKFLFVAHNVGFEKDIWRNIMVPRFGFPDIPNERWACTQAVCAYKSVPQGLDAALKAVCGREKDTEGSKLVIGLSRFGAQRRLWRANKGHPRDTKGRELQLPERTPELMERCYAYCASDVEEEGHLHTRLGPLPSAERSVWLLDQTINERGVRLDREFLLGAQRIVVAARAPLEAEFRALTDGINPGQVKAVVEWIGTQGVQLDNLQKQTIADLLGDQDEDEGDVSPAGLRPSVDTLPGNVRRALAIRSLVGSASIRKISRMEACIADDGRAHRLLQYHGTGPGRWAGRLFNPLNFPRGTAFTADDHKPCDPDTLAGAILSGSADVVRSLSLVVEDPPFSGTWRTADPIEVVSSALRHAIVSGPGRRLVVGDFVQIQARIVLAVAGQTDFLAKLAAGMDPYCLTAELIFNRPTGSLHKDRAADKPLRQTGKNGFLGGGFQCGPDNFCYKFMRDCECKRGWTGTCRNPVSAPHTLSVTTIDAYRKKLAPRVADPHSGLWAGLQAAALKAVFDKRPQEAFGIRYELEDGWLSARLLDGKKIWYWNPQLSTRAEQQADYNRRGADPSKANTAIDGDKLCWKFQTVRGGRLVTTYAYGGLLTENVVMGLERQLLVRAMQRCEDENLPVILNSYDEIVCEPEEAHASWPALQQIMEDTPEWARTLKLPIKAEGWTGSRYKKG